MSEQQTLAYGPGRRSSDPVTCQPISPELRGRLAQLIYDVHRDRPFGLTDDELCALLPGWHGPTVKTCRSRLSKAGVLVDSGSTRRNTRDRLQIVWRVK